MQAKSPEAVEGKSLARRKTNQAKGTRRVHPPDGTKTPSEEQSMDGTDGIPISTARASTPIGGATGATSAGASEEPGQEYGCMVC